MNVRSLSTAQLFQTLPAALGTRRVPGISGIGYLGDDFGSQILAIADAATARAARALQAAAEAPKQLQQGVTSWAYEELGKARDAFLGTASAAAKAGYTTAGDMLATMGDRVGQALAGLGRGAGEGFKGFWGISPSTGLFIGAGVILLLAFGGLGFLGLTPGGGFVARGIGAAYTGIGSGVGGGLQAGIPVAARALAVH